MGMKRKSIRCPGGVDMIIRHIAMYVLDLEGIRDFYIRYFGATANSGYHNPATGLRTFFLSFDGGTQVEIMSRPEVNHGFEEAFRTGYTHLAFGVGSRDRVDRLTRSLEDDGFSVIGAPRVTGDGYYESVVLDPEGNRIEITE